MTALVGPKLLGQGDFRSNGHGNLEAALFSGGQLQHVFGAPRRQRDRMGAGQMITRDATGPASIIQSDFGGGDHGNFEVVALEGNELVHYFHDNSDVNLLWARGQVITRDATGPASIIQSDSGAGITATSRSSCWRATSSCTTSTTTRTSVCRGRAVR